jgi:hypothetical protein
MKKLLVTIAILILPFSVLAQSIECQLLREKILREANPPDVCNNNYQMCMRSSGGDAFAQNSCQMQRGGCQVGGAFAASSNQKRLTEMISVYKENCEK